MTGNIVLFFAVLEETELTGNKTKWRARTHRQTDRHTASHPHQNKRRCILSVDFLNKRLYFNVQCVFIKKRSVNILYEYACVYFYKSVKDCMCVWTSIYWTWQLSWYVGFSSSLGERHFLLELSAEGLWGKSKIR